MSGTRTGGLKAARTNKEKHGNSFYQIIGAKGGANGTTGGFYYSKAHGLGTHITAGRKGGLKSRRAFTPEQIATLDFTPRQEPKSRVPLLRRIFHRERTI